MLLALALRAAFAARLAVIFNDGPTFIGLAQLMAHGEWARALSHPYHPLYSLSIFCGHALFGGWEGPAVAISIAAGSLAVVAFYVFVRDALGSSVAWIGALLLALLPYAVRFSADVQSDGLYLFFFLWSVAFLWKAWRGEREVWAAAAGVLSGLAYLTRPEGVGVAVVGGTLAAVAFAWGRWSIGGAARWAAALGLGVALPMAPYLLALRRLRGEWMLSPKKSIGQLSGFHLDSLLSSSGLPWLIPVLLLVAGLAAAALALRPHRRWRVVSSSGRGVALVTATVGIFTAGLVLARASLGPKVWEFAQTAISTLRPELAALVVVGGLATFRRTPSRCRGLFIGSFLALYAPVLFGLLVNVGYLDRRHVLPPLVLLLGYAGAGVPVVALTLKRLAARGAPGLAAFSRARWVAIVLLALVALALPKIFHDRRADALAVRRAAEWLRARPDLAGSLAAARVRTAYYAGKDWVFLSEDDAAGELEAAARKGARYAIIDASVLRPERESASALRVLHRAEVEGHTALVIDLGAPPPESP